ncbi:MAG: type B 50S ribosomal protein L31 [Bacteroidales bacterium]|jgi:large subunit ribosomal protein L31|nr:type B 50S ribosomal protein L31 [Bacteroidales bacterium]
MKKGIHPEKYRLVAFKDMSNEHVFITKSAANAKETIEVNGVQYPLFKLEISNTSHPFYTGKVKLVDTAGRVDKYRTRYQKHLDIVNSNKKK